MKKNGFTLIELLAVIVILGIILVIAIPSISSAILNSRKNSFVVTANEFVDGVRIASLTDPTILPTEDSTFISIADIKLEKGSNTKSPFGKEYDSTVSGVYISYDEENNEYMYSIFLVDESNNGINLEDIKTVDKNDIKIGDAICNESGGNDNGNGDDEEPFVGNPSDWEVSNEQNGTGGYTLLAFTGDLEDSDSVVVDQNYYTDANMSMYYFAFMGVESTSEMTNRNAYTINIPNVVDGKTITELGPALLTACDFANWDPEVEELPPFIESRLRIKAVTIPEGIKKIFEATEDGDLRGSFVFDFNIKEISLPSTLIEIGTYAFYGAGFTQLTIPKSVTVIGVYAFGHFGTLQNITFEGAGDSTSDLVNIMTSAFENIGDKNESAQGYNVTIPASVENIGEYAFEENYINTVNFKGSDNGSSMLTTIGGGAFVANNITSLIIPANVESIGGNAFLENPLTSLTFAGTSTNGSGNDTSHLTTIENSTFNLYNVNHIVYLPSSLINLQPFSFACDYRDSLCTFYLNQTTIPETIDSSWAGNYARKYILNGSGGYTCVENCP